MKYIIKDNSQLLSAISELNSGDELCLQEGEYESFDLKNAVNVKITGVKGKTIVLGGEGSGIGLYNCKGCTVSNISAKGAGRKYDNKHGIGFSFENCTDCELSNCEASGFQHAGVEIRGGNNILIEYVKAYDNGFCGINSTYLNGIPAENITVRHCTALNNAGDPTVTDNHSGNGILFFGTNNSVIEYSLAAYNGWDMQNSAINGPVGIWTAHTDNIVIRYCISHDNRTQYGHTDGGGFDFDGGTTNSVIEYCLSFSNHGAGYLICQYDDGPALYGNTVRCSVSINDGSACHKSSLELCDCGSKSIVKGGIVENCVFVNSCDRNIVSGHIDDILIKNCAFIKNGSGKYYSPWYLDRALDNRLPENRQWGKVTFENINYCDFDTVPDQYKSLVDFAPVFSPDSLSEFFKSIGIN